MSEFSHFTDLYPLPIGCDELSLSVYDNIKPVSVVAFAPDFIMDIYGFKPRFEPKYALAILCRQGTRVAPEYEGFYVGTNELQGRRFEPSSEIDRLGSVDIPHDLYAALPKYYFEGVPCVGPLDFSTVHQLVLCTMYEDESGLNKKTLLNMLAHIADDHFQTKTAAGEEIAAQRPVHPLDERGSANDDECKPR